MKLLFMNTNEDSGFQAKLGREMKHPGERGICYPSSCSWTMSPWQRVQARWGELNPAQSLSWGICLDFAGVLGVSFLTALGLFPFSFINSPYEEHISYNGLGRSTW